MKRLVVSLLAYSIFFSQALAEQVLLKDVPVEYMGGVPSAQTEKPISGTLTITRTELRFAGGATSFAIPTDAVHQLSSGEFAKRRVKGALVGSILLSPLFLFSLIGKKKRVLFVVEYETEAEMGAAVLRMKKKGGRDFTVKKALESCTGLKVQEEVKEEKKKKKEE